MTSTSDSRGNGEMRTYDRADSVVFLKTNEPFGGLSNMAGGFPLRVNGIRILTSEALYQACRFPHRPEVQRLIIGQTSPMTAKMKSKPYRHDSRPDWDQVRIKIMRWCLRVKLVQNFDAFSKLLLETGDRPIVEQSRQDDFWGARPVDEHTLVGMNVLGRLLMELRDAIKAEGRESFLLVKPLGIQDFLLDGRPIEAVTTLGGEVVATIVKPVEHPSRIDTRKPTAVRPSLFDPPAVKEASSSECASQSSKRAGIGELKPYPAYKDSGVQWLGEVPEHWEVLPNRAIFTEVIQRDHPDEQMLSVTITKGVIRQRALLADNSKKDSSNLDKSAYKLARSGDIVYNKMRAWQGAIGVSNYRGIVSPAYVVQRPREGVNSRYIHYLLRTPAFAKEAERWSYGITSDMWSLRPEHFKMIYGCLPPLPEQAAIVRFLDHMDQHTRHYIGTKQKLSKLLEEQKQVIIHRAITRGLDPNARLKPSGIDWVGYIPEHWKVMKLAHVARVSNGTTPSRMRPEYWQDGTIPWLSSGKVNDYIVETPSEYISERGLRECSLSVIPPGAVIMGMVGQGKTRGMTAFLAIEACINQNLAAIVPSYELDGRFLHQVLISSYKPIREHARGGNQEALNCEIISSLRIPLPSLIEQKAIVNSLDEALNGLLRLERTTRYEIDLIREYRTRLIADVVTGKLDVRSVELPYADKAADLEGFDDSDDVADPVEETDEVEVIEEEDAG